MVYLINKIRSDFPILKKIINNKPLTYLDNAASTQKPNIVINSQKNFYKNQYGAAYRGIYSLGRETTNKIEKIRGKIANFINADIAEEIIFTKGTTEGINLVAHSWGEKFLSPGDNILISEMEHHSNIVPWQILAKKMKLELRYIPLLFNGNLDISKISYLVNNRTKLLAISHISNLLGTINPLEEIIDKVRKIQNVTVLVDGAQSAAHKIIDVKKLNCDFYVFSGHKIYGPSGIGILYGKREILDLMPPWEGGGSMIESVSLKKGTTFSNPPWRFEAGSINTAGIIGLGASVDYLNEIGLSNIQNHEKHLMEYALISLKKIPKLVIYGCPEKRIGIIAFNLGDYHAYDVGSFLDQYGIAIRTGHHCAMPITDYYKVKSMCRISLAMYNNKEDIDRLSSGLLRITNLLS